MSDIPPIQSTVSSRAPKFGTKHLAVVVIGLVVIVALLKARKQDIPRIVEILAASSMFCAIGWTLAIAFLLFAALSIWILIRVYEKELARVSKERDDLQAKLLSQ